MASISPIGATPEQLPPITPAQAAQSTGATSVAQAASPAGDTSADTTTYVTNADGSVSVTTSNAQGEVIEISTLPAPVIAAAANGTNGGGPVLAPGALLNLVA